jgi:hypothetical protein
MLKVIHSDKNYFKTAIKYIVETYTLMCSYTQLVESILRGGTKLYLLFVLDNEIFIFTFNFIKKYTIENMKNLFGDNHGLDEKSVEFITKAIEKANLPGFDYVEFKMALTNLAKMNIDEATAIKSAYGTAMTMGLTKEKLLETANHYKNILLKEKEQFDAASIKQQDNKIGNNLKQADELQKKIVDNELTIKRLQQEIDESRIKIRDLDYEREQVSSKIEEAKTKFLFTHQSILNQIEKDIENISSYL